jgi:Zn-dependent protease
MNLVIAIIIGVLLRVILAATDIEGGVAEFLLQVIATIVIFNIALFFFNLIPLAPLDGWKIMLGLVPHETARDLRQYEQEAMFALMMLIFVGFAIPQLNLLGGILGPFIRLTFGALTGV